MTSPPASETRELPCKRCAYSLRGLPDVHVCPECGLRYDPSCVLIALDFSRGRARDAVLATLLIATLAVTVWRTQWVPQDWHLLALLLFYPLVYLMRRFVWAPSWLLINREGIHLEYRARPMQSVPWADFAGCTLRRKNLLVLRCDNRRGFQIALDALETPEDAERLHQEILRLQATYGS